MRSESIQQGRVALRLCCWIVAALPILTGRASAADYREIGSGDMSGSRLAPTSWTLSADTNRLIAGTSPGDQEYLCVNLPSWLQLQSLVVEFYTMSDMMFIGVQQGPNFSVTPAQATAGDMYGYAHFGTEAGNVGTNILDDMGAAPGAIGFTPPLASGKYTFWLQQGTAGTTTYQLNFNVSGPPGDYNGDGSVSAADYTVWQNTVGSTTDFRADGTGPAGVPDQVDDHLDFNFWKQNYGNGTGSGAENETPNAAPEPNTSFLNCVAALGLGMRLRVRSNSQS
jgi:hypothetical protein